MSVPIPPPNVDLLEKDFRGRFTGKMSSDWYNFFRDSKNTSDNGDMPSGVGVSGATLDAIQTAVALAMARNGAVRSNGETPVGIMTASQWRNVAGLMESPVIPVQPRITQLGNGVTLIQNDTATNITNYPASLYNPGIYFASDTFGIYRSDGTGWTLLAFISDVAYAASWDGVTTIAPSKNAVYDQFVVVLAAIAAAVSDAAYGAGWDGVTTVAPSKNAVYDQMQLKLTGTGVNFGPAAVASITVVNGAVTAIS